MSDTHLRSITKTVSYRLLGSIGTAATVWFLTGDFKTASFAGSIDIILKLFLYYIHERLWDVIPYGRKENSCP